MDYRGQDSSVTNAPRQSEHERDRPGERQVFRSPKRSPQHFHWGDRQKDIIGFDIELPDRGDGRADRIRIRDSKTQKVLLEVSDITGNGQRFDAIIMSGKVVNDLRQEDAQVFETIGPSPEGVLTYHRSVWWVMEKLGREHLFSRTFQAYLSARSVMGEEIRKLKAELGNWYQE